MASDASIPVTASPRWTRGEGDPTGADAKFEYRAWPGELGEGRNLHIRIAADRRTRHETIINVRPALSVGCRSVAFHADSSSRNGVNRPFLECVDGVGEDLRVGGSRKRVSVEHLADVVGHCLPSLCCLRAKHRHDRTSAQV